MFDMVRAQLRRQLLFSVVFRGLRCRCVEQPQFHASGFDTAGLDVPETKARLLLHGREVRDILYLKEQHFHKSICRL